MILIVTHRHDLTADYVILELKRQRVPFFRFNTDDFPRLITITWSSDGSFAMIRDGDRRLDTRRVDTVWYRRVAKPHLPNKRGSQLRFIESECRAFLDALWKTMDARWISPPASIGRAEGKPGQAQFARRLGLRTPRTIVTNDPAAARRFLDAHQGRLVAKPIRERIIETSRSRRVIFTTRVTQRDRGQLRAVRLAPVILQEEITKDFEVRITAIGKRLFATALRSQETIAGSLDWRRADVHDLPHQGIRLPKRIRKFCQQMLSHYNLKFGAFDFAVTPTGEWVFFELNPNGQWAWIEPLTGQPLRKAMVELLRGRA